METSDRAGVTMATCDGAGVSMETWDGEEVSSATIDMLLQNTSHNHQDVLSSNAPASVPTSVLNPSVLASNIESGTGEGLLLDVIVKQEVTSDSEELTSSQPIISKLSQPIISQLSQPMNSQPISPEDFIIKGVGPTICPSDVVPNEIFQSDQSHQNEQEFDSDALDPSSLAILNELSGTSNEAQRQSIFNEPPPMTPPVERSTDITSKDSSSLGKIKMEQYGDQFESKRTIKILDSQQEQTLATVIPQKTKTISAGGAVYEIKPTGVYLSKESKEYQTLKPGGYCTFSFGGDHHKFTLLRCWGCQ